MSEDKPRVKSTHVWISIVSLVISITSLIVVSFRIEVSESEVSFISVMATFVGIWTC